MGWMAQMESKTELGSNLLGDVEDDIGCTRLTLTAGKIQAGNFLDGSEIQNQNRRTSDWISLRA